MFKLGWVDLGLPEDSREVILVALALPSDSTPTFCQLATEYLKRKTAGVHARDMPCPSELTLTDKSFNANHFSPSKDLGVRNSIFPGQLKDALKALDVERFQVLQMATIQCPKFRSIQEDCQRNSLIHHEFGASGEVSV